MNDTSILREAASRLEPDVDRLVAAGTARGRRLRRRRRLGAGIATVAVVGLVAVSAATLPSLLDGGAKVADTGAPADGTSLIPSEDVQPDEPKVPPPADAPDPSVRAKQLPGLVTRLFGGTVTDADEGTGGIMNGGESYQIAHIRWNGMMTSLGVTSAEGTPPLKRCRENLGEEMTCVARPDGSVLLTWTQTGPALDGAVTGRGVQLYVEGWDLFAISYNAADGKLSPVLADEPPFTYDQLTTIVDDPAWFD
jgi:hypothetical protein